MPRNGSGTYQLPAGNPVVAGTTITTTWANPTMADVANALTGSLAADGQTPLTGTLKFASGNAASPGIAFNAEASTGVFWPGTGTLGFSTSGAERMRISSTNLLVGYTSDSGERLQVNGAAKIGGNLAVGGDAAVTGNTLLTGTLGVTGATTLSSLTFSSGTLSGNLSVGGTLGVTGATTLSTTLNVTGNTTLGNFSAASGSVSGAFGVTGATTLGALGATNGSFSGTLGVTGLVTLANGLNVTGAASFATGANVTGNVVLSTTGNRFQVAGGAYVRDNSATYGALELVGSKAGYSGISLTNGGGVVIGMYDATGNGGVYDATSGWQLYWNRSAGCMGIGGAGVAVGYKMQVNGNGFVDGSMAVGGSASVTKGDITTARVGGNAGVVYFGTSGTRYLYYDGANYSLLGGSITVSGDVIAYSDIRIKDDIEVIPNALDKVSQLRGVTFTRKDREEGKRFTGVIAQEVEQVLPEAVEIQASSPNNELVGLKTVAYGNMVGLLIEAIKELNTKVDSLRKGA